MITLIQSLPAGTAMRIFITPPAGATKWRVLRRTADAFTGPTDAGAFVVSDGQDNVVLDTTGLVNGTEYFYKVYSLVGGAWVADVAISATPSATYTDDSTDAQEIVRSRLQAGLLVEVQRNNLTHDTGRIPCLLSVPTFEDAKWPLVTVHVTNAAPEERFLGEEPFPDSFNSDTNFWEGDEGWLTRVQLSIVGWSLNGDERKILREAIRRVVQANLPVFDGLGLYEIEISQQDQDDFESYSAPVFQSVMSFSCLAISAVMSEDIPVSNVTVTPTVTVFP